MKYLLIVLVLLCGCPASEVGPQVVDTVIDDTISSLNSQTIVRAYRDGSNTHLELSDGRHIIVRGYKGHHFYERSVLDRREE